MKVVIQQPWNRKVLEINRNSVMIYGWLDRGFKKFVQFWNRKVFIHKGIKIGTNCYIHHSASLEIIRGGNIELGRDNIIMNG